ncbi:DNA repair protein RAD51 homolog 4 isoform X2 [Rhodamnia argentea]|uniref:DNA repair protein RAD51 homolog 4 isoform X2 n=1 Tax=Rhodamnia argentea TaxID=178133 RepID=A0ABM3HV83_9MYRT|nr:DNA repair protein RAD51 homolog 4 isoform X2 [Rhodamnia argentea]
MASLKRLETEFPILDRDFQSFCALRGIFTVQDFLIHDLQSLVADAEQQTSSERFMQVLCVIDGLHRPWSNGVELMEDAQKNKHVLSTGCEGMDFLLRGGLHKGQVTELAGPSSSGKTQFCLLTASTVAYKHMGGVIYLDTGNSFSAKRIAQFLNQISRPAFDEMQPIVLQKVMNSILCQSVFDIFSMFDVLHCLESKLKSQMCRGDNDEILIIIDSISSLITPILGSSGSQGRALMVSAMSLLKKLAHEYNLAVLVTNHTVGGDGGIPKPALGESWKTLTHVRLLLSRDCGSDTYHVSLLKHPSAASGKAAKFIINN